jgi:PKD repeat protein
MTSASFAAMRLPGRLMDRARRLSLPAAGLLALAALPGVARAATPTVPAYGQIAAVGGFDSQNTAGHGVAYGTTATTNPDPGTFIDPLGMAVDASGAQPFVYVLDLTNPQALPVNTGSTTSGTLTYRIQKFTMGSDVPVASTTFSLTSTRTAADVQAVALAVSGAENRVDVLVDDQLGGRGVAMQIDEWNTSLTGQTTAVSTATLQTHGASPSGDIDGLSLAFAGTGTQAELALGGNLWSGSTPKPAIERFTGSGAVDGAAWSDVTSATNAIARSWRENQTPTLYALSANPDGSLNVTFGPQQFNLFGGTGDADNEPIMATVSADLSQTTPQLPAADTAPDRAFDKNFEIASTDATVQDTGLGFQLSGGSPGGGTLAPSVTALDGGGGLPGGLYAGLVYEGMPGLDTNDDSSGHPLTPAELPAWTPETAPATSANLGIRIFDPAAVAGKGNPAGATSQAMIGNATPGGVCSLQGGSYGLMKFGLPFSMIALAPGPGGTVYALVQPDLQSATFDGLIDPGHPADATGDEVIEFGPGAGTACPQPSGSFAVTGGGLTNDTGTGPITVQQGTKLSFDASTIDLAGGVAAAYSWTLGGGDSHGEITNVATPNSPAYQRPTTTASYTYNTIGTYAATLAVSDDFGTDVIQREIDVVRPAPLDPSFTGPATAVAGQPVSFTAVPPAPGQTITDYQWSFGGTVDLTKGPSDTWVFDTPGTYQVTLTIHGAGSSATSQPQTIVVVPGPPLPVSTVPASPTSTTATTGTTPGSTAPGAHNRSPTTMSPRVASIRRATALRVTLTCASGKTSCAGTVTVHTATAVPLSARRGAPRRKLTLGSARFSVPGGTSRPVTIRLSSKLAPALGFLQLVKLNLTVAAHDTDGDAHTQVVRYYLTAPPTKGKPYHFG